MMNDSQRESERISVPPDILVKASDGDATAQLTQGKAYLNARFIENNYDLAFEWIARSAEQGNMEAQFRLGNLYALGHGTAKSFPEAYKWYTKAAIQGYKKAQIRIHNLYQEDIKMHCRGQLNSEEKEWTSDKYKKENNIRELYEYRIEQNKSILNGAIDYYTHQFNHYRSSNQDDPIVQLNLAFLYQHGYGVKKCIRWAFHYYELAAEQGNIDAQYNLGYLYQKHTSKKFNYRHAFKWFNKSAQGGNIASQRCLAYFYLKGLATDIDYDSALSWYTKAANSGDSEAQVTLGKLYRKGDYIKQDLSIAVRWYTMAARQGNIVAQNCLSQLYQRGMLENVECKEDILEYMTEGSMEKRLCTKLLKDISRVGNSSKFKQLNELAKKASVGDGPAMYDIGLKYYNGDKDFAQDIDTGIKWIKHAANAKYKRAQMMIAELYKKGDSVEQDYRKAYIWYKVLAKQKDASAQYNVGFMYDKGLGVREDPLEASKWYIWSADQENSDAQYGLGMLRYNGRGIREDHEKAVEWLYKSVHQRNIDACYELGNFYFFGHACLKINAGNGLKLLEFAAINGHIPAQLYMAGSYQHRLGAQKNIPKCIEYFTMAANLDSANAQYYFAIIYLDGHIVEHDYVKAYSLFKKAKDNGHIYADRLFRTPIMYIKDIKDYSKVVDMFSEVTETKMNDLAYHIGLLYEKGVINWEGSQLLNLDYAKAEEWYLIASKKGDQRADYRLGIMQEFGKGVERNMDTAIYYYNKAAINENSDAMYRLACMYLNGYGIERDPLESFRLYTKASILGHQKASAALAVFQKYERTLRKLDYDLFSKDPEIPVHKKYLINMLEKATEKGYARLQYHIGLMYLQSNNIPKAFKWLNLAVEIGITDAYYRLGVFYEKGKGVKQNYSMAATMYQKAAEKDHEDACYRLGQLYQYGRGVGYDYIKAYNFYTKAAEMGHSTASKVLNITLQPKITPNGDTENDLFGVQSKEFKKSLTMCKYVAKHGNVDMQFKVGFAYEKNYKEPHYLQAHKWYTMAAKCSHREAIYRLGLLYEQGLGVTQDYHKANELYKQAYELGSDNALYRFGLSYHYGKGVEINPMKAISYYTLAAERGNPIYQCEFGRLYEEGEIVPKNQLEALKWYTKAYTQGYDAIGPKLQTLYENEPYENFFFERLFKILSVASRGHFKLSSDYKYNDFLGINSRLGALYVFGLGTNKDLKKAFECFSVNYSNEPISMISNFNFLRYAGFSVNQKNDILNQLEADEEFINQLKPEQLYTLGMLYYDGVINEIHTSEFNFEKGYTFIDAQDLDDPSQHVIIEKNYRKSFNYMKRAKDKGYSKASLQLGIMYCCGHGVDKDSEQGEKCFEPIQDKDHRLIVDVALLYHTHNEMQNFSKAFECYTRLEKLLDEDSEKKAFSWNKYHTHNEMQDFSKAFEWYTRLEKLLDEVSKKKAFSWNKYHTRVCLGLGLLYEYGDGVHQDYQKALGYYKKLAQGRNSIGCYYLGLMYYHGKGVLVDYKESLALFQKTTTHLFLPYSGNLPIVYSQDHLLSDDSQKNLVYCSKSEQGIIADASYYLGVLYKNGQGTSKDDVKAQYYFREALRQGCKCAKNEIEY